MTAITGEDILNIKMQPNDAKAETIRDYLKALVRKVYEEDEGFDGKRPFGKSGWWTELYEAIENSGINCAEESCNDLIHLAIDAL